LWGLFFLVLWRTTRTYRDFPWRSSRLIKRSFHHRLWRLPYTEVLVCHKQRVKVFHSNLSIERSWVPFRCWVSLFLTRFTSPWGGVDSPSKGEVSPCLGFWFLNPSACQVCLHYIVYHVIFYPCIAFWLRNHIFYLPYSLLLSWEISAGTI
jgi:hypothetical protein